MWDKIKRYDAIFGDIYKMPLHGIFTTEVAGGNRKCRGTNCNNTILKNKRCLTEKYVTNQVVGRGMERVIYKKLSYCPRCSLKRIDSLYENLRDEFDTIEKIKANLERNLNETTKKGRYALL